MLETHLVPTSSHLVPDEVPVPPLRPRPTLVPPVGDEDEVDGTGRSSEAHEETTSSRTRWTTP